MKIHQETNGDGSPVILGNNNTILVVLGNVHFAEAKSTASSMSLSVQTTQLDRDSFGLRLPKESTEEFIKRLPVTISREEAMLGLLKGLREDISRVVNASSHKGGVLGFNAPYGHVVTEETVKSWHDRLSDIEKIFAPKP